MKTNTKAEWSLDVELSNMSRVRISQSHTMNHFKTLIQWFVSLKKAHILVMNFSTNRRGICFVCINQLSSWAKPMPWETWKLLWVVYSLLKILFCRKKPMPAETLKNPSFHGRERKMQREMETREEGCEAWIGSIFSSMLEQIKMSTNSLSLSALLIFYQSAARIRTRIAL